MLPSVSVVLFDGKLRVVKAAQLNCAANDYPYGGRFCTGLTRVEATYSALEMIGSIFMTKILKSQFLTRFANETETFRRAVK